MELIPIEEQEKAAEATWPQEEVRGRVVTRGQRGVRRGSKDETYGMRRRLGSRWSPYSRKGSDVDSDREEYCSGPFRGVGSVRRLRYLANKHGVGWSTPSSSPDSTPGRSSRRSSSRVSDDIVESNPEVLPGGLQRVASVAVRTVAELCNSRDNEVLHERNVSALGGEPGGSEGAVAPRTVLAYVGGEWRRVDVSVRGRRGLLE